MVSAAPINVQITSVEQAPPPVSPTVAGIVGTAIGGGVAAGEPESVGNLVDAATAFGAGSIYDACRSIFSKSSARVVGIRFDEPAYVDVNNPTPAELITREENLQAAIAALRSSASTGSKPTILAAPGETRSIGAGGAADTATVALGDIAEAIRAIAIVDGDTVAANRLAWALANGGPRILMCAQDVAIPGVAVLPGAAFLVGSLIFNDSQHGISDSFSNRDITGLASTTPNVAFEYTDANSEALILRRNYITSLARDFQGTWRVIGGLLKTTSATDPLRYLGVRRQIDEIESTVISLGVNRWNRNQRAGFLSGLVRSAQEYLDLLVGAGILTSALVGPDPRRNTAAARGAGRVYLMLRVNFPAINEEIHFGIEVALV